MHIRTYPDQKPSQKVYLAKVRGEFFNAFKHANAPFVWGQKPGPRLEKSKAA